MNIITERFELPSGGSSLIYGKEILKEGDIASLTTADELKRLSPNPDKNRNLAEILKTKISPDLGIDPYDLVLGDYHALIFRLRTVTYDSDLKFNTLCPWCNTMEETVVKETDLPMKKFTEEDIEKYSNVHLDKTNVDVRLKFLTPRLVDKIDREVAEMKKKIGSNGVNDWTLYYNIFYAIDTVDGEKIDEIKGLQWVKDLPLADSNKILQYSQKLQSLIGLDTEVLLTCDNCKLDYTTQIKIGPEFFRPRVF